MAAPFIVTTADEVSRMSWPGDGALPDLRVVALGGGTGLPTVLRGLRAQPREPHPGGAHGARARFLQGRGPGRAAARGPRPGFARDRPGRHAPRGALRRYRGRGRVPNGERAEPDPQGAAPSGRHAG